MASEFLAERSVTSYYTPQAELHLHQHHDTIAVYAGGTLTNNRYKWYKDGILVTIIRGDSTFIPTENGNYYAEITNSVVTGLKLTTDTITFTNSFISNGSVNLSADRTINLSPNPAQNILHVGGLPSTPAKLTVVDFNGNIIVSRELSVVSNGYDLNVSSLHAGNYLLKIEVNGAVVTRQFVKE